MLFEFIFLQAQGGSPAVPTPAPGAETSAGNPYSFLLMVGGIIVVFYFFMIRPQQRKQKEEQRFRESLKKGDKIITIGGMHGRVVSVEDDGIFVEVDNGVKIKFEKAALRPAPDPQAANAKK